VSCKDKQRVAAARKLEALGYSYRDGEWKPASASPAAGPQSMMTVDADAMPGALQNTISGLRLSDIEEVE
jgi:hypothetical protein